MQSSFSSPSRKAFTLIELLVVIAIIALLIGILLPGLSKAKQTGKMVQEQAAAKQLHLAWAAYAVDSRDKFLPGYTHWGWAHPHPGSVTMMCGDPNEPSKLMEGTIIKSWPWHIISGGYINAEGLMIDKATMAEFRKRPAGAPSGGVTNSYNSDSFQAAIAWHPSFGMNSVFVGGDYNNGAFGLADAAPGGNPYVAGGMFYCERLDQVRQPSTLMAFCASRGGDVNEGGWWSYGMNKPDGATHNWPGYYYVEPPIAHPVNAMGRFITTGPAADHLAMSATTGWSAAANNNNYTERGTQPSTWGMLHPRHFKKVTSTMVDGHIAMYTLEDLRDMRRWSNYATKSNWQFPPSAPWDRNYPAGY